MLWVRVEEVVTNDGPKDCVSKELKPLVGGKPMIGTRGVSQSAAQQFEVSKFVTELFFAFGQVFVCPSATWRAVSAAGQWLLVAGHRKGVNSL